MQESLQPAVASKRLPRIQRRWPLLIAAWVQLLASLAILFAMGFLFRGNPGTWMLLISALWGSLFFSGLGVLRGRTRVAWWVAVLLQVPLLTLYLWLIYEVTRGEGVRALLDPMVVVLASMALASLTQLMFLLRPRTRLQYSPVTAHPFYVALLLTPRRRLAALTTVAITSILGYQFVLYCLLWDAVQASDNAAVTRYLRCGAPLGWGHFLARQTPLHAAVDTDAVDGVQALLDGGARINGRDRYGDTPLATAASGGHLEMVKYLLSRGADVNSARETVFYSNNPELIRLLMRHGMDLNQPMRSGEYPLAPVADRGNREMAALLLHPDGHLQGLGGPGATGLLRAAITGDTAGVRRLLAAGTSPEARDAGGFTALMGAAAFNRPEAARLLLEAGANINAQDRRGRTALYWAVPNGMSPIIRLLMKYRPNLWLTDYQGDTVLDRSDKHGMDDVTRLLESSEAVSAPERKRD